MKKIPCAVLSIHASSLNKTNLDSFFNKEIWYLEQTAFLITGITSETLRQALRWYILAQNSSLEIQPTISGIPIEAGQLFLALQTENVFVNENYLVVESKENLSRNTEEMPLYLPEIQDYMNFVKSVFKTSHIGIFMTDAQGNILKMNQGFLNITGFKKQELPKDKFVKTHIISIYQDPSISFVKFTQVTTQNSQVEWNVLDKIGNIKNVLVDMNKIITQKNTILYLFFVRDITKLKKQQRLLTETEQNAQVGGWELDLMSGELSWTKEIYRIYEIPENEEINLYRGLKYYKPESLSRFKEALLKGIKTGEPYDLELCLITQNKTEKWVRSMGKSEQYQGKLIRFFGTIQDITLKKYAEEELFQSYKALKDIRFALDVANIISITDAKGVITYVNTNFCKATEYQPTELIGKTHRILNSGYHPKEFFKNMWDMLNAGKVWQGEICNKTKSNKVYWVYSTIVPFLDKNKKPIQFISIRKNITARKEAEQKLLTQYKELQKTNHELDKFVYSASHDLRAPVTSILGLLEIVRQEFPEPSIFMYVRMIEKSLRKIDQILHEVMEYSQNSRTELTIEPISLPKLANQVIKSVKHLKESIRIDFYIELPETIILTDKTRLEIVLSHLISNAIIFHDFEKPEPYILVSGNIKDNKLTVNVKDNGLGVMKDEKEKIFKMFHRSSEKSKGAGLGLYIVKETLEKLNGAISVVTEEEQGSTFTCKFPIQIA